jgi:hypothetical protein
MSSISQSPEEMSALLARLALRERQELKDLRGHRASRVRQGSRDPQDPLVLRALLDLQAPE